MKIHFLTLLIIISLFLSCETGVTKDEAARVYYNLGNSYQELGKDQEAGKAYARAWELNPGLFNAGYNIARLALDSGRIGEGRVILEELLAEDESNTLLIEALAWSYILSGDEALSIEKYQEILSYNPIHSRSLYNLAVINYKKEEWKIARDYYWNLYSLEKRDGISLERWEILFQVALLDIDLDSIADATEYLEALIEDHPTPIIIETLGNIYQDQRLFGKALEVYDRLTSDSEDLVETEVRNSILFNKALILLTVVEDESQGLEVLAKAVDGGFADGEKLKALLDYEGFLYKNGVEEIIERKGLDLDAKKEEVPSEEDLPIDDGINPPE